MNPKDLTPKQRKFTAAVSALLLGGVTFLYSGNLTKDLNGFLRPAAQAGIATTAVAVSYLTNPLNKKEEEKSTATTNLNAVAGASPPRKKTNQPNRDFRRADAVGTKANRGKQKVQKAKGNSIAAFNADRRRTAATEGNAKTNRSQAGKRGVEPQTKLSATGGKVTATRQPNKSSGQVRVSSQTYDDGSLAVTLTFSGLSGNRFKKVVRHNLVNMKDLDWSRPVNARNGERSISTTIPKDANREEVLQSIIATSGAEYKA